MSSALCTSLVTADPEHMCIPECLEIQRQDLYDHDNPVMVAGKMGTVRHRPIMDSVRPDWEFWPEPEPDCYDLAGTGNGTRTGFPS